MADKNNKAVLNTTVDKEVKDAFNARCKTIGVTMGVALEAYMRKFAKGEIEITIKKNTVDVDFDD